MKILKDRILKDGKAIGDDILKVDSFLNHQLDVELLDEIGKEFAERFSGCGINKILTVESSGIAIACSVSRAMGYLPVVFAKKTTPSTMTDGFYSAPVRSFTKGTVSDVRVSEQYIGSNDRILIIDDFLASGEAGMGLLEICRRSGAECIGLGAVIEKYYQGGSERLRKEGIRVESLAVISSIHDGNIVFKE